MLFATAICAADLSRAEDLFNRTDYAGSLALLDRNSPDPATNFLIGRNHLMSGDFKKATDYLEKAVAGAPDNSDYQDWLGRAYGKRAETSNILSAPGLASKARRSFEKAVEVNPSNRDALDDLFDYYLNAPGFMGGGYDKAEGVANRIAALDPAEGLFDRSKLDEKVKNYSNAEQHLRQAIAFAPRSIGHVIALARLLAREGRTEESEAVFAQGEKMAPGSPRLMFAHADVLIKQKRDLDEAKTLLKKYLQSPITADDPPREEASRLLKQAGG